MALKLDITDDRGVKTRYHKIVLAQAEWPATGANPNLIVTVRSYVNKDLRDREAKLGDDTSIQTRGIALPPLDTITLPALYEALKALPEWADATDC